MLYFFSIWSKFEVVTTLTDREIRYMYCIAIKTRYFVMFIHVSIIMLFFDFFYS